MPDRLRAGLQFLVLTMLVRIQLGQQKNPYSKTEGVFCFSGRTQALLEMRYKNQKTIFSLGRKKCFVIGPLP